MAPVGIFCKNRAGKNCRIRIFRFVLFIVPGTFNFAYGNLAVCDAVKFYTRLYKRIEYAHRPGLCEHSQRGRIDSGNSRSAFLLRAGIRLPCAPYKRGIDDYVAYGIRACSDGNHAARGRTDIAIPLIDLYNRKYSLSFRSYGFPKMRILAILMGTDLMRSTFRRVAAGICLKRSYSTVHSVLLFSSASEVTVPPLT